MSPIGSDSDSGHIHFVVVVVLVVVATAALTRHASQNVEQAMIMHSDLNQAHEGQLHWLQARCIHP
jgi:hypothetical protein